MHADHKPVNGMRVIAIAPTAVYLRLTKDLQRPISGGCECKYCLAHPDEIPMWDTLGVPTTPNPRDYSWTVHAPEWTSDKPFIFRADSTVQRDHKETGR